jgi:L-gulonolactone oxidase
LSSVPKINPEKRYVIAQSGITLHVLHAELAKHNLAMINVGSISDQTLGGIVTTATHGSGINYGVISTHVIALTILSGRWISSITAHARNGQIVSLPLFAAWGVPASY